MVGPTITAMINNDYSRLGNYYVWTLAPFGRIFRDVAGPNNIFENPYNIIDKVTGIPHLKASRLLTSEKEKSKPTFGTSDAFN